ncbi:hypothetical protein NMY22_g14923 [Coprinellus aureogranulatus]|nr:hypothetical protein NMY22_g14923 [Coprinellus aureogranulatus]
MSVQNLNTFDPFADEGDPLNETTADVGTNEYIHIRIQQRNGRKTLTTLQGLPKRGSPFLPSLVFSSVSLYTPSLPPSSSLSLLPPFPPSSSPSLLPSPSLPLRTMQLGILTVNVEYDPKKLLKAFKKEFACNGTLVEDEKMGQVIQLQGDQRAKISTFLVENGAQEIDIAIAISIHSYIHTFINHSLARSTFNAPYNVVDVSPRLVLHRRRPTCYELLSCLDKAFPWHRSLLPPVDMRPRFTNVFVVYESPSQVRTSQFCDPSFVFLALKCNFIRFLLASAMYRIHFLVNAAPNLDARFEAYSKDSWGGKVKEMTSSAQEVLEARWDVKQTTSNDENVSKHHHHHQSALSARK